MLIRTFNCLQLFHTYREFAPCSYLPVFLDQFIHSHQSFGHQYSTQWVFCLFFSRRWLSVPESSTAFVLSPDPPLRRLHHVRYGFTLMLHVEYSCRNGLLSDLAAETPRVVPLTCHGHSRPITHLSFSSIVDDDQYYLISACKGSITSVSSNSHYMSNHAQITILC